MKNNVELSGKYVSQIKHFIKPDEISDKLKSILHGSSVTHGQLSITYEGTLADMEWGVFDLLHRPFVHHTYPNFVSVIASKDVSVLITPWKGLPIYFQVVTSKLDTGLFYQFFSVLGIIQCHQVSKMIDEGGKTRIVMDWYLASHWIFKPLQKLLNFRLSKLQLEQNAEDIPLRKRRLELRKRGVCFITDKANFINSNELNDHVILPDEKLYFVIEVSDIPTLEYKRFNIGKTELLLRKEGNSVSVYPGMCPHEGALLDCSHLKNSILTCPWHGRKFYPQVLSNSGTKSILFLNLIIQMEDSNIVIRSKKNVGEQE